MSDKLVHHLFKRKSCTIIVTTPWESMKPKSLLASMAPSTVTVNNNGYHSVCKKKEIQRVLGLPKS